MENTFYDAHGDSFRGHLQNGYATAGENYTGYYDHQDVPVSHGILHPQDINCGDGDTLYASHTFGCEVGFKEECTIQPSSWADPQPEPPMHLHAPMPRVGNASVFPDIPLYQSNGYINIYRAPFEERFPQPQTYLDSESYNASNRTPDYLPSPTVSGSSQSTFPTPSELLVELSVQEKYNAPYLPRGQGRARICPTPSRSAPGNDAPPNTANASSIFSSPHTDSTRGHITSHEKKRQYLECLENYVAFLHNHFRRVGLKPTPLECTPHYHGLDSRSIRSLLVHMEKVTQQMREGILKEERRFIYLCNALECQAAGIHDIQNKYNAY